MKKGQAWVLISSALILGSWGENGSKNWISEKLNGYTINYRSVDKKNIKDYKTFIESGVESVSAFFSSPFHKEFDVFVHPNRRSLDSVWQKDWQMPGFKSECWMVASGIATKLDMISPKSWDKMSCEHKYSDTIKTQQLIAHELVHVFHGQQNTSPDFSKVDGIDWFIEGLATYASGQCDSVRISEIKKLITDNKVPQGLENFWIGKHKYGLSGSVVMYLDTKYGRAKLKELLPIDNKSRMLSALKTTETELLEAWKLFVLAL